MDMNTPLQMILMMFAGWVNEHQRAVIAYLQEENRVLCEIGSVVTPDTILRWHRELIARKYDGSEARAPRRPAIGEEIRALVALEVWTGAGLVRHLVFFVIDLSTRRVEIAGIAPVPNGLWMKQVARNLIDDFNGFLSRDFRALLTNAGVKPVRLPPKSPNLNAYAERFVLSIKSECLDRMVFLGEGHLRRAIQSYVDHYHLERSHQGLRNRLIESARSQPASGPVARQERLCGLLNHHSRAAA